VTRDRPARDVGARARTRCHGDGDSRHPARSYPPARVCVCPACGAHMRVRRRRRQGDGALERLGGHQVVPPSVKRHHNHLDHGCACTRQPNELRRCHCDEYHRK